MKILVMLLLSAFVITGCSKSEDEQVSQTAVEPDNSGRNVRDRDDQNKTAGDQSESEADRASRSFDERDGRAGCEDPAGRNGLTRRQAREGVPGGWPGSLPWSEPASPSPGPPSPCLRSALALSLSSFLRFLASSFCRFSYP